MADAIFVVLDFPWDSRTTHMHSSEFVRLTDRNERLKPFPLMQCPCKEELQNGVLFEDNCVRSQIFERIPLMSNLDAIDRAICGLLQTERADHQCRPCRKGRPVTFRLPHRRLDMLEKDGTIGGLSRLDCRTKALDYKMIAIVHISLFRAVRPRRCRNSRLP